MLLQQCWPCWFSWRVTELAGKRCVFVIAGLWQQQVGCRCVSCWPLPHCLSSWSPHAWDRLRLKRPSDAVEALLKRPSDAEGLVPQMPSLKKNIEAQHFTQRYKPALSVTMNRLPHRLRDPLENTFIFSALATYLHQLCKKTCKLHCSEHHFPPSRSLATAN